MKKIIKLTESDLVKIVKKCIKEQSTINEQAWLRKLLGTSVDDLLKTFGDDAVKNIEVTLQRALSKPINFIAKNGINYLKSASGAEVSMETIEKAMKLVSQGKLSVDEVINYLPRNLADGTEFRSAIKKALESKGSQKVASKVVSPLRTLASQSKGWLQITNVKGNMSGWKFHISSYSPQDVDFLYEKLLPVINKWGAGFKLASDEMLTKLSTSSNQIGKGATIYIPTSVVKAGKQREFLSDIERAITGYKTTGKISGDKMINDKIGYRYELSKPTDPNLGVDMNQYRALYSPNQGGSHNTYGNPDLFDF
jgi:hypothetical protein